MSPGLLKSRDDVILSGLPMLVAHPLSLSSSPSGKEGERLRDMKSTAESSSASLDTSSSISPMNMLLISLDRHLGLHVVVLNLAGL